MKRVILALALALMALPMLAQVGQDPNESISKLVTLKYADPQVVRILLNSFGVHVDIAGSSVKMIAMSGKRSNVMTAEDAIKQIDIPSAGQKDIDLVVYFVVGSDRADLTGSPIPSDLQSTVATLKTTFPYKGYVLLDALSLRTRSGARASTTGQLTAGRLTSFSVQSASLEGDGQMVRLDNLHAGLRIPVSDAGKTNYVDTGITTEVVDVKEGQKLVVGRSSLNGPDTALFLVLIAKIVP